MAVTIDDMQVDVQSTPASAPAAEPATTDKETMSFRGQKEMLAERELRLKAD